MRKTCDKSNYNRIIVLLSVIIVFVIRCIPVFFMKSINITTDEYSVISMAAYMAGHDWSSTMRHHIYYGYCAPILYFFVFKLDFLLEYPVAFFRILLMINVFISTIGYIFVYKTVRIINYFGSKKVIEKVFISLTLFFIPTLFSYEKIATNESIYLFFNYFAFYLIIKSQTLSESRSYIEMLLGIVCVLAYACNGRGIAIILMVLWAEVWMYYRKEKKLNNLLVFMGTLIISYIIHKYIKKCFCTIFFSEGTILEGDYVKEIFELLFSFKGWILIVLNIICTLFAFLVGTNGIGFVCILGIFFEIKRNYKNDNQFIFIAVNTLLFLATTVFLTGLQFPTAYNSLYDALLNGKSFWLDERVDKLFYDRYIAVSYPYITLLFIILCEITSISRIKKIFLINLIIILLEFKTYIWLVLDRLNNLKAMNTSSPIISAFLLDMDNDFKYGSVNKQKILGLLLYILIIDAVIFLIVVKKKKLLDKFLLLVSVTWIIILSITQIIPRSNYYFEIVNQNIIQEINQCMAQDIDVQLYSYSKVDYLYQMQLLQNKVKRIDLEELLNSNENIMVIDYIHVKELFDQQGIEYIIKKFGKKNVLISGEELINYYENK